MHLIGRLWRELLTKSIALRTSASSGNIRARYALGDAMNWTALERTSYEVYFFKKSEYSTTHTKCEYHFLRKQKISLVRSANITAPTAQYNSRYARIEDRQCLAHYFSITLLTTSTLRF